MKKKLFLDMVDLICDSFPVDCEGCPLKDLWKKKECSSCEYFCDHYQNDAEIVLATWIGGVDFVKTMGEQEPQKEPWTRREILQAAERCVCGDRDASYGGPEDSFALIASLWEPIIRARCVSPGTDVAVDAVTVALLMAELKIARAATNAGHMDSWVDLAGYAAGGGELAAREADKNAQV